MISTEWTNIIHVKKDLHKINDVVDNDVIILRPLSFAQKYTKQNRLKIKVIPSLMHGHIIVKFFVKGSA